MPASSSRLRRRFGKVAVAVFVTGLHALLLLGFSRAAKPPTTRGDGSSEVVAMTLALAPASVREDPRSQGADASTLAATSTASQAPTSDRTAEAQGAGDTPVVDPGGAHLDVPAQVASSARAGGGGGDRDDPWARASLAPIVTAAATGAFAPPVSDDARFRAHVQPCLKGAALGPLAIAAILSPEGAVLAAEPIRPAAPPGVAPAPPTSDEARAIAAIRACAPYGDPSPGRLPVLRLPAAAQGGPAVDPSRAAG